MKPNSRSFIRTMRRWTQSPILLAIFGLTVLAGCEKPKAVQSGVNVSFQTEPEGVAVSISGKEIGVTPFTKRAMPGNYLFKFSKSGFGETWEKVQVPKSGEKTVNIQLEAITASVMIKTEPEGVKVEIDGRSVGETPLILKHQSLGVHKAQLKKMNYVSKEISWDIRDARPKLVEDKLISNIGSLRVVSDPDGATILVNDNNRGITPFKGDMEQGSYTVLIRKQGYAEHKEVVAVQRDEEKQISVTLQILPGALRISSEPTGVELTVNGKQYQNTPIEIKDLAPGLYKIRMDKDGYDPYIREVDVLPGQTIDVKAVLDSNTGGIDLVANPPGVTIYLDGKKVGISEPGDAKGIAKVFELRTLSMGSHTLTLAHKRADPPQIMLNVKVPKGGIARPDPVTMWIADTSLELKDGTKMVGRIRADNEKAKEILFEITPRILQRYGYDEIKQKTPLKYEE